MNTSLRNLVLFLASCSVALGQGSQLPKYTVATLPSASSYPTYTVQVIDGTSATDCTVGGGGYNALCMAHAGVWVPVSSAQGITSVTIPSGTPQTGPELTLQSLGGTVAVSNPSANIFNLEVASGSSATYQTRIFPNCGTTGTTNGYWAMFNSDANAQCIRQPTAGDLTGLAGNYPGAGSLPIVGIVISGGGTTGNAVVAVSGTGVPCQFDSGSAPGATHMVQISINTPGACQDLGQTPMTEHTYWSLAYATAEASGAIGSIQNVSLDNLPLNYASYQNAAGTSVIGNLQFLCSNATGGQFIVPCPLFTNGSLGFTNNAIYTQVPFRFLDTLAGDFTSFGTLGQGSGGNDLTLDTQSNTGNLNNGRMFRLDTSTYTVPWITNVSGTISAGIGGSFVAGDTTGVYQWTLMADSSMFTPIYDNPGHFLQFTINPNSHTWTWPAGFQNMPATLSGTTVRHFNFYYDGSTYYCWSGDGCTAGSTGISGMTTGQVAIAGSSTTITSSKAIQGTDTNLLSSGTISGTGAALCTDANGGATTSGCAAGSSAFSSLTSGTNTSAAMVVGSGASLAPTGTGTVQATNISGTITAGSNVTITGSGTTSSPYSIASTGGGGSSIASVSAFNFVPLNGSTVASITTGTSVTVSSGQLLMVACGAGSTSPPASIAVTDSLGNTFVNSGTSGAFDFRGTGPTIGISYSIATVGGSDTFTCTPNTSQQYQQMVVGVFNMPATPTFNTAKVYTYVNTQVSTNASVYFTNTFTSTGRTFNFFCVRSSVAVVAFAPQIGNWPANYLGTDSNDPSSTASTPGNLACMWNTVPNAIVAKGVTQVMNLQSGGNTVADAVVSFTY